MRLTLALIAAAAALAVSGAPAALAQTRAAAPRTAWATTVTSGADGSHIVGNPAAAVKLVEYVSYTCPHCAHFAAESAAPLRTAYLPGGTVSVEIRHLVRDPIDMAMAVAANCGAPARFVARHEALMAAQGRFITAAQATTEAQRQQWSAAPAGQRLRRVADDVGVTAWMRERGFTAQQINACMADVALQQRLVRQTNAAIDGGVQGTPSFAINGQLQADVHAWEQLRPLIDARLAAH